MNSENINQSLIAKAYYKQSGHDKSSGTGKSVFEIDKLWQKGIYVIDIAEFINIMEKTYPEEDNIVDRARRTINWANSENLIIKENKQIKILPIPTGNKENFQSTQKADKRDIIHEYLPTKSNCERVIRNLSSSASNGEIDLEELLNELEKDLTEKGKTLKSNWKIITEENLKLWSI